jgi:hypothetical protein
VEEYVDGRNMIVIQTSTKKEVVFEALNEIEHEMWEAGLSLTMKNRWK